VRRKQSVSTPVLLDSILQKLHLRALLLTKKERMGNETGETAEEDSMTGHAETHTGSVASRCFALPACPNCNDLLFAPAASEFVSKSRVRHIWSCDACGHEFSTSVQLSFQRSGRSLS
jgi:hypothetical protein